MTEHDHWMQLICDASDDDGPRLEYAKWLSQRGDPRGRFIQLQCDLAQMKLDDSRYTEISRQLDEQLVAYEQQWLGALAGRLNHWLFRRGFLTSAGIVGNGSWQGASLHAEDFAELVPHLPPTLTELVLGGNRLGVAGTEVLVNATQLPLLTRLDLSGYQPHCKPTDYEAYEENVGREGVNILVASPWTSQLRDLNLSLNLIDNETAIVIAASPHLTNLERCKIHETNDEPYRRGEVWFTEATVAALRASFGNRLSLRQDIAWNSGESTSR